MLFTLIVFNGIIESNNNKSPSAPPLIVFKSVVKPLLSIINL